jgi:thiamine biosynthesis lipoprotein
MIATVANTIPLVWLSLVLWLPTPCRSLQPSQAFKAEFTEVHMGLPVRIVLHAESEDQAREAARTAFRRIATLDQMMSDYRPDSELRRLERLAGDWTAVSPELFSVLTRAAGIARASGGAFDPTVGPLVALWRDARRTGRMPAPAALAAARTLTGWQKLALDPRRRAVRLGRQGMRLDLGGIAKGYILQEALRTLRDHAVTRALVESGGDIVVGDAPPDRAGWRIEVGRADAAFRERAGRLTNQAIATSGATSQFVEIDGVRYSHVVDPRTGLGVTNHVLANVIGDDATTVDAVATALTVLGPEHSGSLLTRVPDLLVSMEPDPARVITQPFSTPSRRMQ